MTENELFTLAKSLMDATGWTYWFPKRTWGERDIAGIFDFISFKGSHLRLVQITTISNVSHRVKKIKKFCAAHNLRIETAWIWGWDEKIKRFRFFKITN